MADRWTKHWDGAGRPSRLQQTWKPPQPLQFSQQYLSEPSGSGPTGIGWVFRDEERFTDNDKWFWFKCAFAGAFVGLCIAFSQVGG